MQECQSGLFVLSAKSLRKEKMKFLRVVMLFERK